MVGLGHCIPTKHIALTSGACTPALYFFRVGPEYVKLGPGWGSLLHALNGAYWVQGSDGWRQSTVNAGNHGVDESREGEEVQGVSAMSPHGRSAVLAGALVVKPEHLSDVPVFMAALKQLDQSWVAHFEGEQLEEGPEAVECSAQAVSHEDVVCSQHVSAQP
ncbi:hypothetical protein HPB48_009782 [Haemaphysalis longicornis]|uniref:Uncharacterized protein n=1 Tax=Haemaphysalis longicornis TaxID=44386 RepID=A0A9J6GLM6_HAELO|nr:hypothetical protein HPB48_009782 [Haemaphysalis longicornis]